MRNRLTILLLLFAVWRATAQIPTLTNAATLKFKQGNTIFDRPVSDLFALVGAENVTVTGNWTFSSNLTQLKDAGTYFYDDGDNTKLFRFQASGITTATTRNFTVPNADGTLALTSDLLSGMTGDVTLSGYAGSVTSTIAANAVTDAKFRQSAALSVVGRSANSTGNVADIAAAADGDVLRRSGTTLGFGDVSLTDGVTGTLPVANGGTGLATLTANRIPYGNGTSAFQSSANLTFDGTSVGLTGRISQSTTGTYSGTSYVNSHQGTITTTTNNAASVHFFSNATLTNSGSVTGNSLTGFESWARVTDATASATGVVAGAFLASSNSANVALLQSFTASLSEAYDGGSLTNRNAFRANGYFSGASTNHTVAGAYLDVQNTGAGRWGTAYGFRSNVSSSQTALGGEIQITTNRGISNSQRGIRIFNDVSGAGVTCDNAYGIEFRGTTTTATLSNYYSIYHNTAPTATSTWFLFGNVSAANNYLAGAIGVGTSPVSVAKMTVRGAGATSSTNALLIENSAGTDAFIVRDDLMSAFGTTPVSTVKLTARGATSDNTTKAFVAERSSGTAVFGAQNDGKVSINNAAYTEELTINGQAQLDGVIFTSVTGSTIASGHVVYTDNATHGGYLTVGDGDRQLAIMPTMIERAVIDYAVNWTTGRKGAFWTVPARFDGWKIAKAYISVTAVGSGAGDDILEIEFGGVTEGTQTITAGTHTLVMDDIINTDDIITFNPTSISATPAQGLHVTFELSKN